MERLAGRIADKVTDELKLDNEKKEIIAYGIFAIMDIALSIILVFVIGLMFRVAAEALIISFTGSILRKYSGGAHASSPGKCAAIGTIICIGQALLMAYLIGPFVTLWLVIVSGILIFIWAYYLIFILSPVDSPQKPIRTTAKRNRMKKASINVLNVYMAIVIISAAAGVFLKNSRFLVYSLCIYGGIAWQVFTLTKLGHGVMKIMDSSLNQIFIFKKGGK